MHSFATIHQEMLAAAKVSSQPICGKTDTQ